MSEIYCKACGQSFQRAAIFALLEDLGCSVLPGANYCPKTEDHEHIWVSEEEQPDECKKERNNG